MMAQRYWRIYFLVLLLLWFPTYGYDLYAHSYAYLADDTHSYSAFNIFGVTLPRYFGLSIFYFLTTNLGLPFGWVVTAIIAYPIFILSVSPRFIRLPTITRVTVTVAIVTLVYFYSSSSLSILFFLAYVFSQKRGFILICALTSPTGLLLFIASLLCSVASQLYSTMTKKRFKIRNAFLFLNAMSAAIISLLAISLISQKLGIVNMHSSSANFEITMSTLVENPNLLSEMLYRRNIILYFIALTTVSTMTAHILSSRIRFKSFRLTNYFQVLSFSTFALLLILSVLTERCNFYSYLVSLFHSTGSPVIFDYTWLNDRRVITNRSILEIELNRSLSSCN